MTQAERLSSKLFRSAVFDADLFFEKNLKLKHLTCSVGTLTSERLSACLWEAGVLAGKNQSDKQKVVARFSTVASQKELTLHILWRPAPWSNFATARNWLWSLTKEKILFMKASAILGTYFGQLTLVLPEEQDREQIFGSLLPQLLNTENIYIQKIQINMQPSKEDPVNKTTAQIVFFRASDEQAFYQIQLDTNINIFKIKNGFYIDLTDGHSLIPETGVAP